MPGSIREEGRDAGLCVVFCPPWVPGEFKGMLNTEFLFCLPIPCLPQYFLSFLCFKLRHLVTATQSQTRIYEWRMLPNSAVSTVQGLTDPTGHVEAPRSAILEGAALCLLLEARGAPSRGLDGTPRTQGGREEAGSVEERSLSGLLLPIQARWKSCRSPAAEMRVLPPLAGCLLGRGGGGGSS